MYFFQPSQYLKLRREHLITLTYSWINWNWWVLTKTWYEQKTIDSEFRKCSLWFETKHFDKWKFVKFVKLGSNTIMGRNKNKTYDEVNVFTCNTIWQMNTTKSIVDCAASFFNPAVISTICQGLEIASAIGIID